MFLGAASFPKESRLILFYKIINDLAQVPFDGVLVEAYNDTRRKHNMKYRQIGRTTNQYGQSFFLQKILVHGTDLLSLKLRHWLYLDQIFFKISMNSFPYKGPVEYSNRNLLPHIANVNHLAPPLVNIFLI